MPRSRNIPRQQIGEPALQPETFEQSECLAIGPGANYTGIKMPEFIHTDPKLWFKVRLIHIILSKFAML